MKNIVGFLIVLFSIVLSNHVNAQGPTIDLPGDPTMPQLQETIPLKVFPNPTKGKINVEILPGNGIVHIVLLTRGGRVVMERTVTTQLKLTFAKIDMSGLPNDTYILQVRGKDYINNTTILLAK